MNQKEIKESLLNPPQPARLTTGQACTGRYQNHKNYLK